jgi:hypothetical protein
MRIFLAGATGVSGLQLLPLLVDAGHVVAGTSFSAKVAQLERSLLETREGVENGVVPRG